MKRKLTLLPAFLLFAASTLTASAGTKLVPLWDIAPDDTRDYLTQLNTERGMCYNPATGNVLVASRTGGNRVIVLDSATGAEKHTMSTLGITGGTFLFNMIGAADDGAIYIGNLSTSTTTPNYKLYRWESDAPDDPEGSNEPVLVFEGDPSGINETTGSNQPQRWGDTIAVRGSGTNTQILLGSDGTAACIFTTSNGTDFTPHFLPGALEGGSARGVAFGVGDTFYSKANGTGKKIRRTGFNLTTDTTTLLNDYTVTNDRYVALAVDPLAGLLGTFEWSAAVADKALLFDISDVSSPPVLLGDPQTLPTDFANGNGVGATALGGGRMYVLNTNNGLVAYTIEVTPDIVPPSFAASPASRDVYARGQTTFTVTATGTPPLAYQWYFNDQPVPDATASTLMINPVSDASAGDYKCVVSNASDTPAESVPATLTVIPSLDTNGLTECWRLLPGSRPWLSTGDTERGMDYHAPSQRLYIASRTPVAGIHVVSAADGADIGSLNMTGVAGGTFAINQVGVDLNGAIYACNLTLGTDDFRIYRWENDDPATEPVVVFEGNPLGVRTGDSMDLRTNNGVVEIVAGSRNNETFALFTYNEGFGSFDSLAVFTDAPGGSFGLGLAFGQGNTLWGKNGGAGLVKVDYDPNGGSGTLSATFPTAVIPGSLTAIGLEPATGMLVGIQSGNSDNARLYQIPVPFPDPAPETLALIDQEFLATDNPNLNNTGAVSVVGDKAFVLSTNNGLTCYTITPPPVVAAPEITGIVRTGTDVVITVKGTPGATYQIERSTGLSPAGTWTADGTVTLPAAASTVEVTRAIETGSPRLFFRAAR